MIEVDDMPNTDLIAPFPWYGGKSKVAPLVWERFGDVANFCEPFAGSLAVLLGRPRPFDGPETVNDADGFISNFWRALQSDPEQVAYYADWPVNENDQHAVHIWLVNQKEGLQARLEGDPDYYDAKVAGRWVWGICCWIGSGWCSGKGPWQVVDRKLVHLGDEGRGVHRQRVHLADEGRGVHRKRVHLGNQGQEDAAGVARQRPQLRNAGEGVHAPTRREALYAYMEALAQRLRYVRVCCGDWTRVMGPTPTVQLGLTGVFLDPPYATVERSADLYRVDTDVSSAVREWAIEHGDDPRLRIALCGYEGEHEMPDNWECVEWKACGGYGSQGNGRGRANSGRERIWFNCHCLRPEYKAQRLL